MNKFNLFLRQAGLGLISSALLVACGGQPSSSSSSSSTSSSSSSSTSSSSSSSTSSSSSSSTSSSSSSSSTSISSSSGSIPAGSTLVYAVNAGGAEVTVDGVTYKADQFATAGTSNSTTDPIEGTTADTLYQSERYGNFKYEIPVTNSTYSVQLRFVELYQTTEGSRLFSASVEGQPVFTDKDLYAEVGHDRAYDVVVSGIMVADGKLTIDLSASIDNATISAFAIYSNTGGKFVEPEIPDPGETNPSAGCGTARTIQNGRINLSVNGTSRSYILRVPDNYNNNNPYRLVIGYHWRGGNANQVASGGNGGSTEDPFYGLWDLANNSTIFVAPEGIDAGWGNDGGRDVALTDAILNQLQNGLCIDKSRIFATGFSFGAGMSNALACARANVFRGVALYAGASLSGCEGGTAPVAYFGVHGTKDSVLPFSLGEGVRDRFVRNNGCTNTNPPKPADGSGSHICTSYQGCRDGYPVRWCAHGGDHNPTEKDRGQSKSWVPGEAWQFISQF